MAEEITKFCSQLRINDEEESVLDLEVLNPSHDSEKVSLLLLGRLLTKRSYNVEAFKRTMTNVWGLAHGVAIRVLSPNLFAFQFFHWKDLKKVMDGRPWCFGNMLLLLMEAIGEEQPDHVTINQSPFWVRIENLPFNYRSDEIIRALVGNMGEILELEEDVVGIGRYRRVRVLMDVTKPICRFRRLKDRNGKEFQVDFAYERLPFFCFACGIMGHSERDCHVVSEEDKQEGMGWSLGLKATPRKGRSREIEEERKLRAAKKLVFVAEDGDKEELKSLADLECSLSIMGADPKEGIMTMLRGHAFHSDNEGQVVKGKEKIPAVESSLNGNEARNIVLVQQQIPNSEAPNSLEDGTNFYGKNESHDPCLNEPHACNYEVVQLANSTWESKFFGEWQNFLW